jgi:lactoylglutathione lyase
MISGVRNVIIAVDDQEQAKDFWVGRVGFSVVQDVTYGRERWLEVSPPDASVILVLNSRKADEPRREPGDQLPHSNVFFAADDLQRTYRELTARGVHFHTPPVEMGFGWWSMFEDPDGTRYALGQWA